MDLRHIISGDYLKKRYARANIYDAHSEISYQAKRSGVSGLIRKSADIGAKLIENSADAISNFVTETLGSFFQFFLGQEIAQNLGLFAGTLTKGIAGVASIAVAGGISAAFTQMDHIHQKQNLRDMYADELGAKLGKSPGSVTIADMEEVAKENPVLEQELKRARKQRNFAVPLAIAATLVSFGVTGLVLPQLVDPAILGTFTGFLMKMPVSIATYCAVKIPLQAVGSKIFGLYDETANDHIVDIKRAHERGVEITPADLLPVFAQANEKIDAMIVRDFGGHVETLPPDTQTQAAQALSATLPLEALARDINNGSVSANELLFASAGQQSGVAPLIAQEGREGPVPAAAPAVEQASFQEKLGLHKRDPQAKFVEKVTMEATAEAVLGI